MEILLKEPKIIITQKGIYYEGQILERYCQDRGHIYYLSDVILKKIIVHYNKKNKMPYLVVRFGNLNNKVTYTVNSNQLGIFYKIKKEF